MGTFKNLGQGQSDVPVRVRIERAVAKLKARGVENDRCPRCNVFNWNVDILDIPANSAMERTRFFLSLAPPPSPDPFTAAAPSYPPNSVLSVLSLVCKNCGYSIFHNMGMLDE